MRWIALLAVLAFSPVHAQKLDKAIFAAGCFWCTEEAFEKVPGVASAVSGYIGGTVKNPSYEQVSGGRTGHAEAVEVRYDPSKVSYEKLLDVFWVNHDPTVTNRQFCDSGTQYRPAIFYVNDEQKRLAEASKAALETKMRVVTDILPASQFWRAEEYHQDYYKKNPVRYHFYRFNCGRDQRLEQIWGKSNP